MNAKILVMPAAQYHADPAPQPSLSSSIAQLIVNESPLHAWHAHPRLGNGPRDSARRSEIGSAAHKLALGAGADITVIQFDSYRKKEAQEARDTAIAAHCIPILQDDYDAALALSKPLAAAAAEYMGAPIADCLTERVIIWQEPSGIWCRAMPDLMSPDYRRMTDLKTTQASVSPESCTRRIYADGYYIQNAFYLRAVDALDPAGMGLRRFGFIFAEQAAPYAVSPPIELSEAGLSMGRANVERACRIWHECMTSGEFPGFGRDVMIAEPPAYKLMQQETDNDVRI